MKKVTYREWLKPHEIKAKASGVKLSKKNLRKLHKLYVTWFVDNTPGSKLDNTLFAIYEDHMRAVMQQPSALRKIFDLK